MPTSNKYIITPIIKLAEQIKPTTVLDVGIGFGKWGFLLREYLEVWKWDDDLYSGENRFNWSMTIDGIEICGKYIKELQENIYNKIYIGDMFNVIDNIPNYDLIILGDVIEHFDKEKGKVFISKCLKKTNKAVIICTPIAFFPQGDIYNNPSEEHKSLWTKADFREYGSTQISYIKGSLIAVLSKMDKKFKFENRYVLHGNLNRVIAFLQSRNIRKYGIKKANAGLLMSIYSAIQAERERQLQRLNF